MKNIVCPISQDRISEHIPRINAFFTIAGFIAYLLTGILPIAILLAFDFLARGYGKPQYSLISRLSNQVDTVLKINSAKIDLAPKQFAAKLGGFMSLAIITFHIFGLGAVANTLSIIIVLLASLELVFNLCVGCYLYTWIALPLLNKKWLKA